MTVIRRKSKQRATAEFLEYKERKEAAKARKLARRAARNAKKGAYPHGTLGSVVRFK